MIEDEARDAMLVEHTLKAGGFRFSFKRVDTEDSFQQELRSFKPSLILSDHGLPSFDGFAALAIAQQKAPDVPFIFVTGSLGEEMAIGKGKADFPRLFKRLKELNYNGPVTIEREISGPQQMEDIKREIVYLRKLIA